MNYQQIAEDIAKITKKISSLRRERVRLENKLARSHPSTREGTTHLQYRDTSRVIRDRQDSRYENIAETPEIIINNN